MMPKRCRLWYRKSLSSPKMRCFSQGQRKIRRLEHNLDRLTAYLKSPAEHTVVVFTVDADKLDERKKIVKALKDIEAAVPFLSLSPEELKQWVAKQASQLGFTFSGGPQTS